MIDLTEILKRSGLIFFLVAGISAYLISMTSLRDAGFGRSFEMLFASSILGIFVTQVLTNNIRINSAILPFLYLVAIITPITFFQFVNEFPGTRMSTLFAYYLVFFTGFMFGSANNDQLRFSAYGIGLVSIFVGFLMLANGVEFNIVGRASFFSDNPNQLALYSLAGLVIVSLLFKTKSMLLLVSLPLVIYGAVAISDAFFAAVILGLLSYFFYKFLFNIHTFIFSSILILIFVIYFLIYFNFYIEEESLLASIIELWREADQGNLRTMLYKHGLLAALNSPVVGLGAGVFSGISGPLQQFESHNTFIDLMTNGGIILSALFYYPFIRAIVSLYKDNPYKSAVITAFLAFTLFHFIARHPIVWIAWGCCVAYMQNKGTKCAE